MAQGTDLDDTEVRVDSGEIWPVIQGHLPAPDPAITVTGCLHIRRHLVRGVREDYNQHVEGYLLQPGFPGRLLFPGNFPR